MVIGQHAVYGQGLLKPQTILCEWGSKAETVEMNRSNSGWVKEEVKLVMDAEDVREL